LLLYVGRACAGLFAKGGLLFFEKKNQKPFHYFRFALMGWPAASIHRTRLHGNITDAWMSIRLEG